LTNISYDTANIIASLNPAPMLTYSNFVTLQEALLTYFMQSLMSDALNFF